jgi:hypothetical protein
VNTPTLCLLTKVLYSWSLEFRFLWNIQIGKGITGVSGAVYDLLGALTLLCAGCCLYLSIKPLAFFAEFLLSAGLVFKGTWVLQTGLSLYTDVFGLKGCRKNVDIDS